MLVMVMTNMMMMMVMIVARHVESVCWCLATAHLTEGMLCVVHPSSVTICRMSATASDVTLTQIHNIGVTALPQGQCCFCRVIIITIIIIVNSYTRHKQKVKKIIYK